MKGRIRKATSAKDLSPQELADALERATKLLDASTRRRHTRRGGSWFSMSHITLGLGLILAYFLTSNLVPRYWESMLPNGLQQARTFWGWPGFLWKMVVACHDQFVLVVVGLAGVWFVGFVLSTFLRPLRPLVWLMAIGVIALNGWILYVAMRIMIEETAGAAGIPLN